MRTRVSATRGGDEAAGVGGSPEGTVILCDMSYPIFAWDTRGGVGLATESTRPPAMRRPVRASDAAGAVRAATMTDVRGTRGANPQTSSRGRPFRDVRGRGFVPPCFQSVSAESRATFPRASATSASLASVYTHVMVASFTAPDASSVPPNRKMAYISLCKSTARPFADTEPGTKRPRPEPEVPAGGGSRDRHVVPRVSTATKRARVTECKESASPHVAFPKRYDENNEPVSSASSG